VASDLAAAGVLLDISGAILLAIALVREDPADFVPASTRPSATVNYATLISRAHDAADAQIGLLLLGLGFALQFLASLGADASLLFAMALVAVPVATALAARSRLRRFTERRYVAAGIATEASAFQAMEDVYQSLARTPHWERVRDAQQAHQEDPQAMAADLWGENVWKLVLKRNPRFFDPSG
jgi:hypothetical protein